MAALTTIAAVAGIAGTGVAAAGYIKQGKAERRAARANAEAAELNAELTLEQGRVAESLIRREGRAAIGDMTAARGASGLAMGFALEDVFQQADLDLELDALTQRYNSRIEAEGYLSQAALDRRAGRNARRAANIGAAATLLGGTATALSRWPSSSKPRSSGPKPGGNG